MTIPEEFIEALGDGDPFVRVQAISLLGPSPEACGALAGALLDDFPLVRREAVRALSRIGGAEATRLLVRVARQDPSAEVREEAVGALAGLLPVHGEERAGA